MATIEELKAELARREAAKGGRPDPMAALRAEAERRGIKPKPLGMRDKIDNLAEMATESATFGLLGDEARAKVSEWMGRGSYDQNLTQERADETQMRDEHPYMSLTADVAGGLAPGAGLVGGVARAATLGGRMAGGVLAGAGAGATYGAMEGEGGLENRMQSAGQGAALGGAIGSAAPALGQLAQNAWRSGKSIIANRGANATLGKELGVSRGGAKLARDVVDGDDPRAMRAALQRGGPNAMLADAGTHGQGAIDSVLQGPGQAARIGIQRVDDRAAQSMHGMNSAMDRTLGAPVGVGTAQVAVRSGTAGARSSAYDAAYSAPIDYSARAGQALEGLSGRIPGKAVADANRLMQLDGHQSRQILARIGDDGSVSFEQMPDVRQWDYIKRALDQAASTGEGQGALGGQTAMGRAYQNLSRTIRDNLGEAVPEYRTALDTASDAISQVKGVEFGAKMLRPSTPRESVRDALEGATRPERAAMAQGVRSQIDETLANVRAVASDPNIDARQAQKAVGDLTSDAAKGKMRMLLGDDFGALEKQLDEAVTALGLRARVAANSRTYSRQRFDQMLNDYTEVGALRRGKPLEAASEAASTLMGASRKSVQNANQKYRGELADVLTRPGQGPAILDMIEQANQRGTIDPQTGTALSMLLQSYLLGQSGRLDPRKALPGP